MRKHDTDQTKWKLKTKTKKEKKKRWKRDAKQLLYAFAFQVDGEQTCY